MLSRILNLALKELIQLSRDKLMVFFLILGPVLELVLLAQATGNSLSNLAAVIVDQDHSRASREIAAAIGNAEDLNVVGYLDSPDQVDDWMKRGQALLAVILPSGLEADQSSSSPQIQLIADGANSMASAAAMNAAVSAIHAVDLRRLAPTMQSIPTIDLRTQIRYNPSLDANYFTITAQLGLVIYQVALVVAVIGLTREREIGTLEQLLVTPLRRIEIIAGKAIPALLIAVVDLLLMLGIAIWGFQVPMQGSFVLLFALSLFFIVAEIGWGLTLAAFSRTQQQAALSIFVLAMVDVLFSGYVLPVERMPGALQVMAQAFPLQHYMGTVRSIMLKGADLSAVGGELLALFALSAASLAVAVTTLRQRLE